MKVWLLGTSAVVGLILVVGWLRATREDRYPD